MHSISLFVTAAISIGTTIISVKDTAITKSNLTSQKTLVQIQSIKESDVTTNKLEKNKKERRTHDNDRAVNRRAVWGFVFGLASVLIFPILAIPGLIMSNDALREERIHPRILTKSNKTLAYLGKYLSIVGIAIIVLAILYLGFLLSLLAG